MNRLLVASVAVLAGLAFLTGVGSVILGVISASAPGGPLPRELALRLLTLRLLTLAALLTVSALAALVGLAGLYRSLC